MVPHVFVGEAAALLVWLCCCYSRRCLDVDSAERPACKQTWCAWFHLILEWMAGCRLAMPFLARQLPLTAVVYMIYIIWHVRSTALLYTYDKAAP